MEVTFFIILLCLFGVSQQAPKELTRRGNIGGVYFQNHDKTVMMENKEVEPKSLSQGADGFSNNQLSHQQDGIKDVRDITPAVAARSDSGKLEKLNMVRRKVNGDSVENDDSVMDRFDGQTNNRKNKEEIPDNIKGENSGFREGMNTDTNEQDLLGDAPSGDDDESKNERTDAFQDRSGDEGTEDSTNEPKNPTSKTSEDSVALFIKGDTMKGVTKDIITSGRKSNAHGDSVASYIGLNRNQEKKGNPRDEIVVEREEEDNQSGTTKRNSDVNVKTEDVAALKPSKGDSVAPYATSDPVRGEAKNKISNVKSNNEDSVASYVGLLEPQETGAVRNGIAQNEDNNDNEKKNKTAEEDSAASFIKQNDVRGETKDVISTKSKKDDSVDPYISSMNKQGIVRYEIVDRRETNDVRGETKDIISTMSKKGDSVGPYISSMNKQGIVRNEIVDRRETNDVRGETKDIISTMSKKGDSVGPYISSMNKQGIVRNEIVDRRETNGVRGERKDIISTMSKKDDSVGPYISTVKKQGIVRNEIVDRRETNGVRGETKDIILTNSKKDDSVDPYISTVNKQGIVRKEIIYRKETSASGEVGEDDSVDSDDNGQKHIVSDENEDISSGDDGDDVKKDLENGDDDDDDETIIRDISGDDEASGNLGQTGDKLRSAKTQSILKGLEEDLIKERSSGRQSKENLTYEPDDLWSQKSHNKTSKEHSSSYVIQQPYGSPNQYNMPVHVPQYIYVSINDADRKGAVCLDGSTPGYFYRRGIGNGKKKWIIYLQGGAWCDSKVDCYGRSQSNLGSSLKFTYLTNAEGLLSRDKTKNPDFYNWNVAYVPYCDGGSYTGNRSHPITVQGRMIYFRGKRILSALLDDLLAHGLSDSDKVVFSGTSAGGLAVILNADYVRSRIPSKVNVYSLADSGMFLDVPNMDGESPFSDSMREVYKLHDSSGSISSKCASHQGKNSAWKCFFPYYFGKYINSPLFIINPLHDSWQLANIIGIHCAYKPEKCSQKEMKAVKSFRDQTLKALGPFINNPSIGLFADACVDHGQIIFSPKWNKIRVRNRSMSGMFSRWMMKQDEVKSVIDTQRDKYPFNPTCVSHYHD